MRTYVYFLIVLIGSIVDFNASSQALTRRYIKHTERLNPEVTSFQNQGLPIKSNRVSSQRGNINMFYDETLPDSVKIAVNTAKSLWESKIQNKHKINLGIEFLPLDDGVAMEVEVGNLRIANLDLYYPSALVYQLLDLSFASSTC